MSRKPKAGKRGKSSPHRSSQGGMRMSWLPWIILGVVVVATAGFLMLLSRGSPAGVAEITPAQAYAKQQAGAFFLDVRTDSEYAEAHIQNSVLIPLDELENRLDQVPRDRDVVVVCRSGARSREGAAVLQKAGFSRVSCLRGGLLAWADAGYAVEQGQ